MSKKKKKPKKPRKPKKKLTDEQKRRKKEFMTIFVNGKQKRVKRPTDDDEFIRNNADDLWYHQNEMWECIEEDKDINEIDDYCEEIFFEKKSMNIPKSDWKKFKIIQGDAIAVACKRILTKVAEIIATSEGAEHFSYLELQELIRKERKDINRLFDNCQKSYAVNFLADWAHEGLVSEENMNLLSKETQEEIISLNDRHKKLYEDEIPF